MLRVATALLAVTVLLSWTGRMDRDVLVNRSVKSRLQNAIALVHSIVVDGHMGFLEAEPVRDFPDDDPVHKIARSVGLLEIEFPSFTASCTATAIAPDLIITNQHCVTSSGETMVSATLHLGLRDAKGSDQFTAIPTPVDSDEALDYAILRVTAPPGKPMPGLQTLHMRDAKAGEGLQVFHHSDLRPLLLTRAHCRVRRDLSVMNPTLSHTCRMTSGSSGSLLFAASDGAVVGLHWGTAIYGVKKFGRATTAAALIAKSAALQGLLGPATP
jgi:hypothetical protein